MEISSIYHRMDKRCCYALEKGKFLFRIKVKKNDMQSIILHMVDKYIPVELLDTRQSMVMQKATTDSHSDYYEAEVDMDVVCMRYFFQLEDMQGSILYFGNNKFKESVLTDIGEMFDCPQNMREEERFVIPEWAANQVVYQIFPSRYAASKQMADEVWYQEPIESKANLQGDLRGVIDKLPYLKRLGIDILYFTPVFRSDSSHKYDTIDYYQIDPAFGTEQDLKELVEKAHQLDIRVLLDAVFNHTSNDFFAFKDIREKGEKSQYLDWYYIKSFPLEAKRGQKPSYKTYSYHGGMPKLNLQNKEAEKYFLDVARYWMRTCNIDGWRLDVGDEICHCFWKKFRQAVKEENKDALIVGEVWHLAGDFLEGDEWDTIMNYEFRNSVLEFAVDGNSSATQFAESIGFMRGNVHKKVFPLLWNLLGSHDTERILYRCKGNKQKLKLAAAIQLLSVGMPMIYYGDEVGLTGGPDPDCRRGMLWKEELQDKEIFNWYQKLIQIRKDYPIIIQGEIADVYTDDSKGILAITKVKDEQRITIVFYNGAENTDCDFGGKYDLLSEQIFDGALCPYQALVLK